MNSNITKLRGLALFLAAALFASSIVHAAPGDVDLNFDVGDIQLVDANNSIRAIAIQQDNQTLIGGSFSTINGTPRNAIARLNGDGSLDATFNSPLEHFSNSSLAFVRAIVVQPDGKILVGGAFIINNQQKHLVRLNPDGSLDDGFNVDTSNSQVDAIVLQPDGKIIIGGFFGRINGTPCQGLARLNSEGSLETALGTAAGLANSVYTIALQPDGKIVIGGNLFIIGTTPLQNNLARLNADGTLDSTFNVGSGANNDVYTVAIQSDGKLFAGGIFSSINGTTTASNTITRLNPDGAIDSSFNTNSTGNPGATGILLQPNGKVIAVGIAYVSGNVIRNGFARFNADGSLDSFYPSNNIGANGSVWATAYHPDNRILIGGNFTSVGGVSRIGIAQLLDTPNNAPPTLNNIVATPRIDENGIVTLSGTISDSNVDDTFNLTVDWGDGSLPQTFNYAAGTTSFRETHQYLDDNPTGTASDTYPINLTLAASGGGSDTEVTSVIVNNLIPSLRAILVSPATINAGDMTTLSGIVADVGTLDTQTVVIDWGDDSPTMTLNLAAGVPDFNFTHQYTASGGFLISITATDDDSGSANASTRITVNPLLSPGAPTDLTARAISKTQINLAWLDNSNNETGFKIERCRVMGKSCNFVEIWETGPDAVSFSNITGLNKNTRYNYRIRAFYRNDNGSLNYSAYSNIASATTSK